jgi:hypothetical protein
LGCVVWRVALWFVVVFLCNARILLLLFGGFSWKTRDPEIWLHAKKKNLKTRNFLKCVGRGIFWVVYFLTVRRECEVAAARRLFWYGEKKGGKRRGKEGRKEPRIVG